MRVLVTGGAGFIGSVLDVEALRIAMSGVHACIHLAAVADVREVFEDPFYAETVNTRGTICVLEAARRCRVKRVIYGSTTWVYSDCPQARVDEETPILPPSHLYTATKLASEFYCSSYAALYQVEHTILRFGIPFGPRARDGAVVPIFVKKALRGEPLTVAGDGSQFRQFVYVEDLAEGVVLSLKSVGVRRTYNLAGDECVSVLEIARTVRELLGDVEILSAPGRPADFSGKIVSSERAKHELGWKAVTPFRIGVERYVTWYRHREEQQKETWSKVDAALRP